jgi:peroxiredoxin
LRTFSGDSLRGQLLSLADDMVRFRTRSRTLAVPRERVAEIIALAATSPEPGTRAPRYRVELVGGRRVSLETIRGAEGNLAGHAAGIGDFVLAGETVLRLETAAREPPPSRYDAWRLLEPAPLPVAASDPDAGADGPVTTPPDAGIGEPAPDFSLAALDGATVRLALLRGKIVIVDFWATWCGPCVAALPALMKVTRKFEDRGVVLLAVNQSEEREAVARFLERKDWDLRVLLDQDGAAGRAYGVEAIPRTVIIDRAGIVRHVQVGLSAELETDLARRLAELASEEERE